MASLRKVQKFTAIAFFVASGLALVAVVIRLLPPAGSLDLSDLGKALLFGTGGVWFWRRSKKAAE